MQRHGNSTESHLHGRLEIESLDAAKPVSQFIAPEATASLAKASARSLAARGSQRSHGGRHQQPHPESMSGVRQHYSYRQKVNLYSDIRKNDTSPLSAIQSWWDQLHRSDNVNFFLIALAIVVDFCASVLYIVEVSLTNTVSLSVDSDVQSQVIKQHEQAVAGYGPLWLYTERPLGVFVTGLVLAAFNLISLMTGILTRESWKGWVFGGRWVLDALTIVPYIVALAIPNGQFLFIPYFLRAIHLIERLKRGLRLQSSGPHHIFNRLIERLILLVGYIFVILYVGACAFQWSERSFGSHIPYDIFTSFYFTIITVSTVGYGDISPVSVPGQITVLLIIIVALSIVPGLISDTLETIRVTRSGGGSYRRGKDPYIVVCGSFKSRARLVEVLSSFYNVELPGEVQLLFLALERPSEEIKAILSAPALRNKVKWLQGSVLDENDLIRAQVYYSSAVFIMPNLEADDHRREDERTTLRAWAVRRHAPNLNLLAYTLKPDTVQVDAVATTSICLLSLKHAIMGSSLLHPGTSTLVLNLLTNIVPSRAYEYPWLVHYGDGTGHEIYSDECLDIFVGEPFNKVSYFLFQTFQVTLIAAQVVIDPSIPMYHVVLNPGSYRLREGDRLIFINQSPKDIENIRTLSRTAYGKVNKDIFESFKEISEDAHVLTNVSPQETVPSAGSGTSESLYRSSRLGLPQLGFSQEISTVVRQRYPAIHRRSTVAVPDIPQMDPDIPLCHLRAELPSSWEDIIIRTVEDAESKLRNTILIVTTNYDIHTLVEILRVAYVEPREFRTIVILGPEEPTCHELETLGQFVDVYFVVGDMRKMKTLILCNLNACDRVLILNDAAHGGERDDFADSSTIMGFHFIQNYLLAHEKDAFVSVELLDKKNVQLLRGTSYDDDDDHGPSRLSLFNGYRSRRQSSRKTPRFPPIFPFTRSHAPRQTNAADYDSILHDPTYAAGQVYFASMIDNIIFQTYRQDCILDIVKNLCGLRSSVDLEMDSRLGVISSFLSTISVPEGFVNESYRTLYQSLALQKAVIPVGLYRARNKDLGNRHRFVYTCPPPDLLVLESDLVYVLKPPG